MKFYWGWVVCGAFLVLFTVYTGVVFSFSEMIIPFSKNSTSSMSTLTWLGALPVSMPMFLAPLATWLHYRIQERYLVIAGVILSSVALMIMPLVDNIVTMLAVFAVVGGFGVLLVVNPPFFLIASYFPYEHPRHVLATSILACSFPLATLIFNPLTYSLIAFVGWRWTYGLYAILTFVVGLSCAATFRPNTAQKLEEELGKTRQIAQQKTIDEKSASTDYRPIAEKENVNISSKILETEIICSNNDKIDLEEYTLKNISGSECKCEQINLKNNLVQNESASLKSDNKELGKTTIALMGTIWFLATLFKCTAYYTPLLILVKQMELMKISHSSASRVMAFIGLCEVVSRLITSFLGDYIKGKTLYMYTIVALFLCATNALATLASTYSHFVIYSVALGILGGPIVAAMYSSCSEVLYGAYVPELFSVFRVSLGIGSLVGPSVAGYLF